MQLHTQCLLHSHMNYTWGSDETSGIGIRDTQKAKLRHCFHTSRDKAELFSNDYQDLPDDELSSTHIGFCASTAR